MQDEETILTESDREVTALASKKIADLCDEANQIIGDYWAFTKASNNALAADKKVGLRPKERMIYFGPRLEKINSGKYIKFKPSWVHYPYRQHRSTSKIVAKFGTRIKATANGDYKLETLLRYSSGRDSVRIVDTEKKLMVLREKIEMFHEMIVSADRKDKRMKRINTAYNEVTI